MICKARSIIRNIPLLCKTLINKMALINTWWDTVNYSPKHNRLSVYLIHCQSNLERTQEPGSPVY